MDIRRKSLLTAWAALGLMLVQNNASGQPAPGRLYRAYGKKASEIYTNIQVLKDIDSTELIPTMQYMAESLGVGCDYCHVAGGSDKDGKMKMVARKMILMTREINKNHFNGEKTVNCNVCHRGAESPVFYPAIPDERSGREAGPAQTSENLPTAVQILDKYLQAVGGAAAVQRITSRVEKGTFISGDSRLPYEIYSKAPDKRAAITHQPDGDTISVVNGTSAWLEINAPSPPGRDLIPSEIAAARLDADLKFAVNAKQSLQGLRVLPPEKIDGKEMYVVSGKPENMRPMRLYFDKQSGLLTRVVRYTEVPLGFSPVQVDYADYRDVDGVKIPFRRTQARPNGRSIVQIDTVQENVSIDEAKFAKSSFAQGRGN
jgi:photosynthetic reaction center cytochrome c subunit